MSGYRAHRCAHNVFFYTLFENTGLAVLNAATEMAASSEAELEKPMCVWRVIIMACSDALDLFTENHTLHAVVTKSLLYPRPQFCTYSSDSLSCFIPHGAALGSSGKNTKRFGFGTLLLLLQ